MLPTTGLDVTERVALVTRLNSIEGQVRGIQRMLDDGRDCQELLDQLAAMRAASHAVTMQALEVFALHCVRESPEDPGQVMTQVMGFVAKLTR